MATLVSSIAVTALGLVLLLDATGTLTLDFGSTAPVVLATLGLVLLARGLGRAR